MALAPTDAVGPKPGPAGVRHAPVPHHSAPVTPGKVAIWLFLATEVMFFTGLIGSYIVLRAGSPRGSYSNLYSPNTPLRGLENSKGVVLRTIGSDRSKVEEILRSQGELKPDEAEHVAAAVPHGVVPARSAERAEALASALRTAGAGVEVESLKMFEWPKPYDDAVNPLAINLTAANTFVLICSSVTMVLALSAIQRGNRAKCTLFLLATVVIGSIFLSVQVYEYRQLMLEHHYPIGISATGHFVPSCSLFASCFFTMTGLHGLHVTAGVLALSVVLIASLFGAFSASNYAAIELTGLYWHFVDLVWIILFTIVYLL